MYVRELSRPSKTTIQNSLCSDLFATWLDSTTVPFNSREIPMDEQDPAVKQADRATSDQPRCRHKRDVSEVQALGTEGITKLILTALGSQIGSPTPPPPS